MSASSFADKIIGGLDGAISKNRDSYTESTPVSANQSISTSITDYLISNTKIIVSYAGVTPAGVPVATVDECPITGSCPPPTGTDFNTWIKSIESGIVSGFFISIGSAGVTPISPPPAFIPGLVLTQDTIKEVHEGNYDDPQKPVWETISSSILGWLNSIVSSPYPATFAGSTGTSTVTKIVVA